MSDEELGFTFRYKQIGEGAIAKTHKNMLADFNFIREALLGPVGVAAGLAMAGTKLVAFGESHATTKVQKEAFEGFRAAVDGATNSLGEATAEALASSGALDAAGRGVELLAEEVGSLLSVLRPLEPLLDAVMLGVEAMMLPMRGLGAAMEFAGDVVEPFAGGISDAGEEAADAVLSFIGLDDAITTTSEAASQGRLLVDAMAASLRDLREQAEWYAKLNKEAAKEEREATAARISGEAKVAEARAIALRGGMDAILAEDKLQAALVTANDQYDKRLTRLRELQAIDPDKLMGYLAEGSEWSQHRAALAAAELQFNAAQDAAIDIQGALDEIEGRRIVTTRDGTAAVDDATRGLFDYAAALDEVAYKVGLLARETTSAIPDAIDDVAAYGRAWEKDNSTFAKQPSIFAQVRKGLAAVGNVLGDASDASGKFAKQQQKRAEGEVALGFAAAETAGRLVSATADSGWADAAIGFGLETARALASIENPIEAARHALAAGEFLATQLLAESLGGGRGGRASGGGGSAPAQTSAPTSSLDARESGDRATQQTMILTMNDREVARGTADSINRSARYGVRISRDAVGRSRQSLE